MAGSDPQAVLSQAVGAIDIMIAMLCDRLNGYRLASRRVDAHVESLAALNKAIASCNHDGRCHV